MPKWKSENGDCFKPFKELCQIEWSTIMVWVFLLMSTFVLGAKEAFQLMHSQKVSSKLCTEVGNGNFLWQNFLKIWWTITSTIPLSMALLCHMIKGIKGHN